MKYQFSIRVKKKGDQNSAASKAVLDCNVIFSKYGYQDYNLVFNEEDSKVKYYFTIISALVKFFFLIKRNSVVAIQYPMLNNIFKHFIKAARQKNVKFFCVIHDIESLRLGGKDQHAVKQEASNLNYYDNIIVHNDSMLSWLREKGVTKPMIPLGVFDYILSKKPVSNSSTFSRTIAFAGNLTKSAFVYQLTNLSTWNFKLYGPNYKSESVKGTNISWGGEFTPEEVVFELKGDFGLIWDGSSIEKCDDVLGNYLRYNNPHKFSLYLAAGLPVIAPADSAIGKLIKEKNIGVLVNSLNDLQQFQLSQQEFDRMKYNCIQLSQQVTTGAFFSKALEKAEAALGVS
jgi:hypothetical protein